MFAASSSAARTQRLALVSVAAFVVLVMIASSANNVFVEANGGEEGGNNIVDAIKYLQGLDKVYGQAARPRFGKRGHTLGSPEAAAAAGLPVDFEELPAAQHQQMMRGFY